MARVVRSLAATLIRSIEQLFSCCSVGILGVKRHGPCML